MLAQPASDDAAAGRPAGLTAVEPLHRGCGPSMLIAHRDLGQATGTRSRVARDDPRGAFT
eukprot:scaffold8457_cov112-Isochrysis_galbana.AAC.6